MDKSERKRGLGRGLSALMADVDITAPSGQENADAKPADRSVPIESVYPNEDQPRRTFEPEALEELAESIRQRGVLQPLIVREHPHKPGAFEIVAGERRWRASQMANLHQVPIVLREFTDTEVLEVAIIENVQRADLNPIEEAAGYKMLMETFGHTQDNVAAALGKSRSHVANLLRLLNLPDEIQVYLREGKLSMGHARALLTAKDPLGLAAKVIKQGLSVRQTEKLAKGSELSPTRPKSTNKSAAKDADTKALEGELGAHLGMPVSISHSPGSEGGKITLSYRDFEQLDELCRILSGG